MIDKIIVGLVALFSWIVSWIGAKAGLIATVATVSLALTAAAFVAIKALIVGLVSLVTYEPFLMAFWACWPANAETCIAACLGADLVVFLYRYKMNLMAILAK